MVYCGVVASPRPWLWFTGLPPSSPGHVDSLEVLLAEALFSGASLVVSDVVTG